MLDVRGDLLVGNARPVVLIVDDAPDNLLVLSELLREDYRVLAANSGESALRLAQGAVRPDLILLDVMMPGLDGHAVLRRLKSDPRTRELPVIFVTALADPPDEEEGFRLGAVDYIAKPIRPEVVRARVGTQIQAKRLREALSDRNVTLEAEVGRRMAESDLIQRASIQALAHLAETRDTETGNHILRTQNYVHRLAERLQQNGRLAPLLDRRYCELLARSAPLHDIGKVGIPDSILLKPGPLTPEEWAVMQTHTVLGYQAIELAEQDLHASIPFLLLAKEIARWHHERWDGRGYPDGLAGEAIPLSARIMAVADVFDALISRRVYKPALAAAKAREIMSEERGRHFDPDIVDTFLDHFDEFVEIAESHQD